MNLPEKMTRKGATMTEETERVDPAKEYQRQVKRWRNLFVMTFLSLMVSLGWGVYVGLKVIGTAEDTNHTVEILEKATGPDAQEAQGEVVRSLVITIDCNTRQAIQSLVDQLQLQGDVTIITPECKETE